MRLWRLAGAAVLAAAIILAVLTPVCWSAAPSHEFMVDAPSGTLSLLIRHNVPGNVVFQVDAGMSEGVLFTVFAASDELAREIAATVDVVGNDVYYTAEPNASNNDGPGTSAVGRAAEPSLGRGPLVLASLAGAVFAAEDRRSSLVLASAVAAALLHGVDAAEPSPPAEFTLVVTTPPRYEFARVRIASHSGTVSTRPDLASTIATCTGTQQPGLYQGCANCCGGGGTCDPDLGRCTCAPGMLYDPITGCGCPPGRYGADCSGTCACPDGVTCYDGPWGDGSCSCDAGACNDGNECTQDSCDVLLGCQHVTLPDGTACDDETVCNGAETCVAGVCKSGSAPSCVDGNICTTDLGCHPVSGCQYEMNARACDDGNACTSYDACIDGECVGGSVVECDDQDPCTLDSCVANAGTQVCVNEPITLEPGQACGTGCNSAADCVPQACRMVQCTEGACVYTPNVTATDGCDDGNVCNGVETCSAAGACVSSLPLVCDDGNACTQDSCVPATGCVAEPVPDATDCSDGNPCNGVEQCSAGQCAIVPGSETACECGPATCDDGNPCTLEVCDPILGCLNVPNDELSCDDGNACNGAEVCQAGLCRDGTPVQCPEPGVCQTPGVCDPATGVCSAPNRADGAPCPDPDPCNGAETCLDGVCVLGAPIVCDDGNPCTDEVCDAATGSCVFANNTLACDDGNNCTVSDVCSDGVCIGAQRSCNDGDGCTSDTCDAALGCVHSLLPVCAQCLEDADCVQACHTGRCVDFACVFAVNDTLGCSDGNVCNGEETCLQGTCSAAGAVPLNCDDGNACTLDSCNPTLGCVHTPLQDGTSCADADACNGAEVCQAGVCTAGTPVTCPSPDSCHLPGVCDAATGVCSNPARADGTACGDGNVCNGVETCHSGVCTASAPLVCDVGNECTSTSCDAVAGCVTTPQPDGTSCSLYCNGHCAAGACVAGADPCTCPGDCTGDQGTCNTATGECACRDGWTGSACDVSVHADVVETTPETSYDLNPVDEVLQISVDVLPQAGGYTWDELLADVDAFDDIKVRIPCRLRVVTGQEFGYVHSNGSAITGANGEIQRRGSASRYGTPYSGFKVKLSKENDPVHWRGMRIINMNKYAFDASRMRNKLVMDLFRATSNIASFRTYWTRLTINVPTAGSLDLGLYVGLEQSTGRMLQSHGLVADGDAAVMYKIVDWDWKPETALRLKTDPQYNKASFYELMEPETDNKDHSRLLAMVADVNDYEQPFHHVVDRWFNLDNMLTWMAANILLRDTDHLNQNWYIWSSNDTAAPTWYIQPWDYDDSLWPGFDSQRKATELGLGQFFAQPFWRRLMTEYPGAAGLLNAKVDELRSGTFSRANVEAQMNQYVDAILPYIEDNVISGWPLVSHFHETRALMLNVLDENYALWLGVRDSPYLMTYLSYQWGPEDSTHQFYWMRSASPLGLPIVYDLYISSNGDDVRDADALVYSELGIPDSAKMELEVAEASMPLQSGTIYWMGVFARDSDGRTTQVYVHDSDVDGNCLYNGSIPQFYCFISHVGDTN